MLHIAVTMGGALIGFLLLLPAGYDWWLAQPKIGAGTTAPSDRTFGKRSGGGGKRKWVMRPLATTAWCVALGALASTSVGGAIGSSAQRIDEQANVGGDHFMHGMTGVGSQDVARHTTSLLSPGGALILLLALVVYVIALYRAKHWWPTRLHMLFGLLSGCILGPTAGLGALVANVLGPLTNWTGHGITGGLG